MLCKYQNSLGKPNQGFHKHFLGIAIFDLLAVVIIAGIIAKIFKLKFLLVFLCLLILGIILHRIFCVNTTFNKLLFGIV